VFFFVQHAPCIIFIDEIDALGGKRSSGPYSNNSSRQTVNQLLAEMDGFNPSDNIIVIAATNLQKTLDDALTRPGRFDKIIEVPVPDVDGREDILRHYFKNKKIDQSLDVRTVAKRTIGFTGADIENLVNEAAIKAALENSSAVSWKHIEYAFDRIVLGLERKMNTKSVLLEDRQRTAIHEAGHAIITLLRGENKELHKISINPRGMALGVTHSVPSESYHYTKT
jgi:ATP-dependent Zn protease